MMVDIKKICFFFIHIFSHDKKGMVIIITAVNQITLKVWQGAYPGEGSIRAQSRIKGNSLTSARNPFSEGGSIAVQVALALYSHLSSCERRVCR